MPNRVAADQLGSDVVVDIGDRFQDPLSFVTGVAAIAKSAYRSLANATGSRPEPWLVALEDDHLARGPRLLEKQRGIQARWSAADHYHAHTCSPWAPWWEEPAPGRDATYL